MRGSKPVSLTSLTASAPTLIPLISDMVETCSQSALHAVNNPINQGANLFPRLLPLTIPPNRDDDAMQHCTNPKLIISPTASPMTALRGLV